MAEVPAQATRSSRAPRSSSAVGQEQVEPPLLTRPAHASVQRGTIVCVIWLWAVGLVVIIGAISVMFAGHHGAMADVYDDRPDVTIPTGRPLTSEDLADVRLSTAVRGYRMDEVDALLARIQADLKARDSSDTEAGQSASLPVTHNDPPQA